MSQSTNSDKTFTLQLHLLNGETHNLNFSRKFTVDKDKIFANISSLRGASKLDYQLGFNRDSRLTVEFVKFLDCHEDIKQIVENTKEGPLHFELTLYPRSSKKLQRQLSAASLHQNIKSATITHKRLLAGNILGGKRVFDAPSMAAGSSDKLNLPTPIRADLAAVHDEVMNVTILGSELPSSSNDSSSNIVENAINSKSKPHINTVFLAAETGTESTSSAPSTPFNSSSSHASSKSQHQRLSSSPTKSVTSKDSTEPNELKFTVLPPLDSRTTAGAQSESTLASSTSNSSTNAKNSNNNNTTIIASSSEITSSSNDIAASSGTPGNTPRGNTNNPVTETSPSPAGSPCNAAIGNSTSSEGSSADEAIPDLGERRDRSFSFSEVQENQQRQTIDPKRDKRAEKSFMMKNFRARSGSVADVFSANYSLELDLKPVLEESSDKKKKKEKEKEKEKSKVKEKEMEKPKKLKEKEKSKKKLTDSSPTPGDLGSRDKDKKKKKLASKSLNTSTSPLPSPATGRKKSSKGEDDQLAPRSPNESPRPRSTSLLSEPSDSNTSSLSSNNIIRSNSGAGSEPGSGKLSKDSVVPSKDSKSMNSLTLLMDLKDIKDLESMLLDTSPRSPRIRVNSTSISNSNSNGSLQSPTSPRSASVEPRGKDSPRNVSTQTPSTESPINSARSGRSKTTDRLSTESPHGFGPITPTTTGTGSRAQKHLLNRASSATTNSPSNAVIKRTQLGQKAHPSLVASDSGLQGRASRSTPGSSSGSPYTPSPISAIGPAFSDEDIQEDDEDEIESISELELVQGDEYSTLPRGLSRQGGLLSGQTRPRSGSLLRDDVFINPRGNLSRASIMDVGSDILKRETRDRTGSFSMEPSRFSSSNLTSSTNAVTGASGSSGQSSSNQQSALPAIRRTGSYLNRSAPLMKPSKGFWVEVGRSTISPDLLLLESPFSIDNAMEDVLWYAQYFAPNQHFNYIGNDPVHGEPFIISVVRQNMDSSQSSKSSSKQMMRVLLRTKRGDIRQSIVESKTNAKIFKSKVPINDVLKVIAPEIVANHSKLRIIKDIAMMYDLMSLEEKLRARTFKFGVLLCKEGQTKEEEMFSNEFGSEAYENFLRLLGDQIELKGWDKFKGGLDVERGTTGTHSIYTKWGDYEIMFHVSTLLPFSTDNPQQLERKRHLGNDIVVLVFKEGNTSYMPSSIASEFIHVVGVVQPDTIGNKSGYRLSVASKDGVPPFSPELPESSGIFESGQAFRNLILAKLINGERAAYKAPAFAGKLQRTRGILLKELDEKYK